MMNKKTKSNAIGVYGNISIWTDNAVKQVDGYNVLDGKWSDYAWGQEAWRVRSNYVKIPSILGHKYLITMKVKNKLSILEIDKNTGSVNRQANSNTSNWEQLSYITNGTGDDLYFLFRSEYITFDIGY